MRDTLRKDIRKFHFTDLLVILLCLSIAAVSLNLFRNDLFQTINSRNENTPIGTIFIRNNNVQRRLGDRVLWGRLAVESPVYLKDLVRVAELSAATIDISGNHIDLGENTLIRVQPSSNGKGPIEIELSQGTMDLSTSGGSIVLNIQGKQVRVGPGTVLNATTGENGMVVQVSEGSATVNGGEQSRQLDAGTMVALDPAGTEKREPAVVVTQPRLTARYLKSETGNLNIAFSWNRINLDTGDALRLELAGDRNFNTLTTVLTDLNDSAQTVLGAGTWFWRISYQGTVLSSGQITVVDASGPELISPAKDQLFSYQSDKPRLRYQWSIKPEASGYILEVSDTPDFTNPAIRQETAATSFIDSSLGPGTWYWRVAPAFPSVYEGTASFSSASSFRIEQGSAPVALVWPEPVQPEAPPPELPVEIPAAVPVAPPKEAPPKAAVPKPPAPPQLLPEPGDCQPASGYRIGIEELRAKRSLAFQWSAVPEANEYIFTLYRQTENGKQRILSTTIENSDSWILDNISDLERGTYIWQVEAVSTNKDGAITRRGKTAENSFTIDVPAPAQPSIQVEDTGIPDGS